MLGPVLVNGRDARATGETAVSTDFICKPGLLRVSLLDLNCYLSPHLRVGA